MAVTELRFSRPPSVNDCWRNGVKEELEQDDPFGVRRSKRRGRYKTARYKRWLATATQEISLQPRNFHTGPVAITYHFPRDNDPDQDNFLKPVNDCLQAMGILKNDNLVEETHLYWNYESREVLARIEDVKPTGGRGRR